MVVLLCSGERVGGGGDTPAQLCLRGKCEFDPARAMRINGTLVLDEFSDQMPDMSALRVGKTVPVSH